GPRPAFARRADVCAAARTAHGPFAHLPEGAPGFPAHGPKRKGRCRRDESLLQIQKQSVLKKRQASKSKGGSFDPPFPSGDAMKTLGRATLLQNQFLRRRRTASPSPSRPAPSSPTAPGSGTREVTITRVARRLNSFSAVQTVALLPS